MASLLAGVVEPTEAPPAATFSESLLIWFDCSVNASAEASVALIMPCTIATPRPAETTADGTATIAKRPRRVRPSPFNLDISPPLFARLVPQRAALPLLPRTACPGYPEHGQRGGLHKLLS